MDYVKIYTMLTENKQHRKKNMGAYYERHHIVPLCMGGTNEKSNLVLLTCREHFLAHWLLVKIYPNNFKLICAWNSFSMSNNGLRIPSIYYEYTRHRYVEALKKNNDRKLKNSKTVKDQRWVKNGDRCTRIHKDKIPIYLNNGWVLGRTKFKRPTPSSETRKKMSISSTGKTGSKESKKKKSDSSKNRVWINKDGLSKFIKYDTLVTFMLDGWGLGRIIVWKNRTVVNSKFKGENHE
jgi:hypothetical protein